MHSFPARLQVICQMTCPPVVEIAALQFLKVQPSTKDIGIPARLPGAQLRQDIQDIAPLSLKEFGSISPGSHLRLAGLDPLSPKDRQHSPLASLVVPAHLRLVAARRRTIGLQVMPVHQGHRPFPVVAACEPVRLVTHPHPPLSPKDTSTAPFRPPGASISGFTGMGSQNSQKALQVSISPSLGDQGPQRTWSAPARLPGARMSQAHQFPSSGFRTSIVLSSKDIGEYRAAHRSFPSRSPVDLGGGRLINSSPLSIREITTQFLLCFSCTRSAQAPQLPLSPPLKFSTHCACSAQ